jgi:hypothetical protein
LNGIITLIGTYRIDNWSVFSSMNDCKTVLVSLHPQNPRVSTILLVEFFFCLFFFAYPHFSTHLVHNPP